MTGPLTRVVDAASLSAAALAVHSMLNWRLLRKTPPLPSMTSVRPKLAVLLPARDEADRIGPTITSVLGQRGVDLRLYVLDDGSTDGTADVVRRVADGDARLKLMEGRGLPDGWLGKPHACAQLADAALEDDWSAQVLVFIDADVVLAPDALAASADMLQQGEMDMLCPYPRQVAGSTAERLVQPLLQWSWLTFLPLRVAERSLRESLAAGNGQLLLCRRDAYTAAGGHEAVRAEVIEDLELARAFKRAGRRVGMADGTNLATCRMYDGWATMREGYVKSLWRAFGGRAGALSAALLLTFLYLVPPLALMIGGLLGRRRLAASGAFGYGAAVVGRAYCAARTGGRPADAVTHPASIVLLLGLVRESWRRKRLGALSWKGRPVP